MKKLLSIAFFAIFILTSNSFAEPQKCIATLAGVKYPKIVRLVPNDYSIKVFYETFGNARELIVNEFKAGRMKIGVNGLWEDNHTFGDQHISKIKSIGAELEKILKQFPGREIKFRPFTEHKVAKPDKYLDIAQAACPSCIIVNSNWQGGWTSNPKYQNETHGKHPYPKELLQKGIKYNFDYDGTNSHDSDRRTMGQTHSKAEEFCDWTFDLNLKMSEKDTTSRPNRIHRPSKKTINSLLFYNEAPKGTHNKLPNGQWIYKHCADRHKAFTNGKEGDSRACTPVIIAPDNGKQIVCKDSKGKKVFTLNNAGKYEDNKRWLYRPVSYKNWGFNYAKAAIKSSGSPVCTVLLDGKAKGTINPGWRDQTYR